MYDKKVTLREGEVHCDRCGGYRVFASHVLNGRIVPVQPDKGICYRCRGTGVDPHIKDILPPLGFMQQQESFYTHFE